MALWTLLAGPSRPARVLDIVAGTVHLQVDELAATESRDGRGHPGAVVALLAPGAPKLPIGIVLPPAAADLMPVSVAGAPVGRGEITIGWGAISLAEVRWPVLQWWNPGIPARPRPARSVAARRESAGEKQAPGPAGLPGLAALRAGDVSGAVAELIGAEVEAAERIAGDRDPVPSGDAVLVGALAALAAWAPDSTARTTLATAVAEALARTSPISAALLQSAAAGFAVPELSDYLTALSTGDPDPDPALAALKALPAGAGSGSAMAIGVVAQLRGLRGRPPY